MNAIDQAMVELAGRLETLRQRQLQHGFRLHAVTMKPEDFSVFREHHMDRQMQSLTPNRLLIATWRGMPVYEAPVTGIIVEAT